MKYCLIFLQEINSQADFATHVPIRYKQIMGSKIDIHVLYRGKLNTEKLNKNGIKFHKYGFAGILKYLSGISMLLNIYNLVKHEGIKIFSNVWSYNILSAYFGTKLSNASFVLRVAGNIPFYNTDPKDGVFAKLKRLLKRYYIKEMLKIAPHVHVISNAMQQKALEYGVDEKKITCIYPGVNTDMFTFNYKPINMNKVKFLYIEE